MEWKEEEEKNYNSRENMWQINGQKGMYVKEFKI